ncbi:SAM-dependent methyltransferase [Streptomyces profundus]|nr:SAM-dependent methyltransferase [Streptomyces sp. MA3_2.13]
MYDYYLGGKTNYRVDREAAQAVIRRFPAMPMLARVNRAFMRRAVRFLVAECRITQFLDVGSGVPAAPNLHEIAQAQEPSSRVAYVDTDPIVLAYADSLLTSSREGRTACLAADLTEPAAVFAALEKDGCLDLARPVGLSLHAVLHFVTDAQDPYAVVDGLLARLAPGSYLSVSHCTGDFAAEPWREVMDLYRGWGTPTQVRSRAAVLRFFDGLELVDPGLVVAHRWRPEPVGGPGLVGGPELVADAHASLYAGVARKL